MSNQDGCNQDILDYIDRHPLFNIKDIERAQRISKKSEAPVTIVSISEASKNMKLWTHAIAAAAGGAVVLLAHKIASDNLSQGCGGNFRL